MIKRPTWIMVIVLAVLAALAYYLQAVPDNFIKKALDAGKTPTAAAFTSATLISTADGPISTLEITAADGHHATLKHETAGWTLSTDIQSSSSTDQSTIDQTASQAQGLRLIGSEIKPNAADLSGFGLDKPAYSYKVTLESGKILNFKIGRVTVIDDGYYLQKEDGTIVVVDKYSMDTLLSLLKQPSPTLTTTPTPGSATEVPTGTITPTPAATATPGS